MVPGALRHSLNNGIKGNPPREAHSDYFLSGAGVEAHCFILVSRGVVAPNIIFFIDNDAPLVLMGIFEEYLAGK